MAFSFISKAPQFQSKIATVRDVLDMEAFNAMYEAGSTSSGNNCDPTLGTAFIKNVVRQIRAGGKKIETNFFMDAYGYTPRSVDSKEIYNRYVTDIDYNVVPASNVTGSSAGAPAWFQLIRGQHSANGTMSYPTEGYTLVDKDNNIIYQITEANTTIPNAHRFQITPWDKNVTVNLRAGKKYFVTPSRIVNGCSCPEPTNQLQNIGYVQKLNPFRFRKDWEICIDLNRGYQDQFRFQTKFGIDGTPYDTWDAYEAGTSRESLQLSINAISMFASPITNPLLLSGLGVITDNIHTGYYGLIPTLQSSSNVIDFAPAEGFNMRTDLQPFILYQDSLKRTLMFDVKHGKGFKAGLVDSTNQLVKVEGLGLYNFDAYGRENPNKDIIKRYGINVYEDEALGATFRFSEWSPLSDTRLIGSEKLSNMAIFIASDGVTDLVTNQPVAPIEFFQYGNSETGDYIESIRNLWKIDGCEKIAGSHAQSVMMAVHSPEMHLLANPVTYC